MVRADLSDCRGWGVRGLVAEKAFVGRNESLVLLSCVHLLPWSNCRSTGPSLSAPVSWT